MPWDKPNEYPCNNCYWESRFAQDRPCGECGKSDGPNGFLASWGTCDACGDGVYRSFSEWSTIGSGDVVLCCSCAQNLVKNVDQLRKDAGIEPWDFWPSACETNKKRSVLRKFRRKS